MTLQAMKSRLACPASRFRGPATFPAAVKAAKFARNPELLGFAITPWGAVSDALSQLYNVENQTWQQQIKAKDASNVLNRAIGYFKGGKISDNDSIKAAAAALSKETGETVSTFIKIFMMMRDIKAADYPAAAAWISKEGTSLAAYASGVGKTVTNASLSVKEGAIDTLHEAADTVKDVLKNQIPLYVKVLIPLVLAGIGLAYWGKLKMFFPKSEKNFSYRSNPVVRTKKEISAAKMFEKFSDLPAKKRRKLPFIDCRELAELGNALELGYSSKKWTGKRANYLHQFGKNVKFYSTPDGKTLVLTGGKMVVTSKGIEN